MERLQGACFPSVREYAATFGIDRAKLRYAKDDAIVMHPGPVNRGVELSHDLADHRPSVILDQVRNGVALRMALLYLLSGRSIQRDARLAESASVQARTTEPVAGSRHRQE